jgi:hypothetical protein
MEPAPFVAAQTPGVTELSPFELLGLVIAVIAIFAIVGFVGRKILV